MKCRYNSKFKKWEPNEIINNKVKLVTFNKIKNLENK